MSLGPALVVGLGNPGPEYAETRHNVGVRVVELLASRAGGGRFSKHKSNADVLEGRLAGRRAVLAVPRTFMNVSGGPVAEWSGTGLQNLLRRFNSAPDLQERKTFFGGLQSAACLLYARSLG